MRAEVKTRWKMPVLRDRECEKSMDCFAKSQKHNVEDYKYEGDADDAGDEISPSFYERCWSNDDDDGDVDLPHSR